jgi:hypothetical protein
MTGAVRSSRVGKHFASSPTTTPPDWEETRLPGETVLVTVNHVTCIDIHILAIETESDSQSALESLFELKLSWIPNPRSIYERTSF